MSTRQIAVIGGGWAGLASAVAASQRGAKVSLFEMAGQLGGRARSLPGDALTPGLDNGQHILIGAYTHSLKLMAALGVDIDQAFLRTPLRLRYPRHEGLQLPPGPPLLSFARGVWAHPSWPAKARLQLLLAASTWLARGFSADARLSVSTLCTGLPKCVRQDLIEPLCVAALNTPAAQASAQVFLRVLRDALFSGAGSADLLVPRQGLSTLMATPAMKHLSAQGVHIHLGTRVQTLAAEDSAWRVNEHRFDQVILACSSSEAARLTQVLAPGWSAMAQNLQFEPIVTVYIRSPGSALPAPMVALQEGPDAPAQFVFDLGQLGTHPGLFAWVISGASAWVARGLDETANRTLAQAQQEFDWASPPEVARVLAEKRATFACTPGLQRPPMRIAPGLLAAGDYVAGPYPATLEGAVRAGQAAASALG
ncbi:hydroxysqualene dehydroxylase HpnE [Roseateles koreensis]|uniref:hydroxysqualene dehydroxylase HpnE n=1 Tax=Roseateles koreensis TaxID=2987526 RepID=UPI0030B907FB